MPTVHLIIKGRVQGVFFRASARDLAEDLGVSGWIRNTEEGHVESVVSGTEEQVNQFVAWCRQGPSGARVVDVEVNVSTETELSGFRVIRG